MTKAEIITALKECAEKLGRAPNITEFHEETKISKYEIRKTFGTHTRLLDESGLQCGGSGYRIGLRELFLDWAQMVRSLGKVPTMVEYEQMGKYSIRPLMTRYQGWGHVPAGMRECARQEGLESEWGDVMQIIAAWQRAKGALVGKSSGQGTRTLKATFSPDLPSYGQPLLQSPLAFAPMNELGVILMFGSMARGLGFVILRVQAGFPDCEAMREVETNRWQRVRIEFEYESRNFLTHMHSPADCDLIVCWNDNWPECPVEVLELRGMITMQ
ncbi:MAG TPA: hypothetical protein VGK22_09090 [Candidatus Angelobacter sp.]|jgi:hypothetical protein